jgi:basic membrane protein A and related proteins
MGFQSPFRKGEVISMSTTKQKLIFVSVAVCLILSMMATSCAPAQTPTPQPTQAPAVQPAQNATQPAQRRVALLTFGTVADGGWNATAYEGLKALASKYNVKIALSDDVKIPDMEAAIRDYCSQGYDLVIAHSTPFGDPALKVAKDFPNCKITVTANAVSASNVASYYPIEVESHFLAGAVMALMSKTGKIGLVGGVELSNTVAKFNALEDGAKYINPNIQVFKSWVGSWDDPAKGKETALTQINQGADVIDHTCATSGLGVIEAASDKNVWVISDIVLNQNLAPKNMIASHTQNFAGMIEYFYKQVADGNFKGEAFRPGLATGLEDLTLSNNVPADVAAKIKDIKQQIIDGKIKVAEKFQ